jgi:hypothetical protein
MRWWAKSRFTTMSWSHSMHTLPNHTRAGKLQYKKDHVWKAWKTPWRADFRRCRNKSSDEISLTRHRSSSRGGWGSVQLDDLAFSTLAVPRRAPPTSRPAHAPRMQATTQLRRAHYPVLTCSIVFVSGVYRRILRPTHLTKKCRSLSSCMMVHTPRGEKASILSSVRKAFCYIRIWRKTRTACVFSCRLRGYAFRRRCPFGRDPEMLAG